MYNVFVDVLIWSFAIYGLINFLDEFAFDFICYIVESCVKVVLAFKRIFFKKKF